MGCRTDLLLSSHLGKSSPCCQGGAMRRALLVVLFSPALAECALASPPVPPTPTPDIAATVQAAFPTPTPTPTARSWTAGWSATSWVSTRTPTRQSAASPPSGVPSHRCLAANHGPRTPRWLADDLSLAGFPYKRPTPIDTWTPPMWVAQEVNSDKRVCECETPPNGAG